MNPAPQVPSSPVHMMWHLWRLIDDPLGLQHELRGQFGPTFVLQVVDGPNLVLGEPALVREVFAAPEDLIEAPNAVVEPLVGKGSVVAAAGARHRRKRKLLMPPFHGARTLAYGDIIRDAALDSVTRLRVGERTEVRGFVHRASLEVIVRAVFGVRDAARVEAYRQAIDATVNGLPAWLLFTSALQHPMGGVGPWSRYVRQVERLRAMLREEVALARAEGPDGREDILSMLLTARDEDGGLMDEEELLDELRALVIAGYETTATTLGWALWAVYRHPDVLARLRAELATLPDDAPAEALTKLPYLGAVCDETLRRWPIVPFLRRRAVRDQKLGPYDVPAGTFVAPSPMLIHFDPEIYPDPFAFRPERFLERKYGSSELFAFGGGQRRCIGAALANFELRVALGTIARVAEFGSSDAAEPRLVMNGITTRSKVPLTLRYEGAADAGRGQRVA